MGMILRIASSRIVGQGDIVGRSGYFSLNLAANSVMRGRLDARRTLKSLVADLRIVLKIPISLMQTSVIQVPKTSSRVSNSVSFLRELSVGYRQTMISCGKRCLGWIFLKSVSRMDK